MILIDSKMLKIVIQGFRVSCFVIIVDAAR